MKEESTYDIDQMKLFSDICMALSQQVPSLPADMRSNAIIDAANMICEAYAMTEENIRLRRNDRSIIRTYRQSCHRGIRHYRSGSF